MGKIRRSTTTYGLLRASPGGPGCPSGPPASSPRLRSGSTRVALGSEEAAGRGSLWACHTGQRITNPPHFIPPLIPMCSLILTWPRSSETPEPPEQEVPGQKATWRAAPGTDPDTPAAAASASASTGGTRPGPAAAGTGAPQTVLQPTEPPGLDRQTRYQRAPQQTWCVGSYLSSLQPRQQQNWVSSRSLLGFTGLTRQHSCLIPTSFGPLSWLLTCTRALKGQSSKWRRTSGVNVRPGLTKPSDLVAFHHQWRRSCALSHDPGPGSTY